MERENFKFGERLEFFKPNFEERDRMYKFHLKFFQDTLTKYWEKLKDYIEYDNIDTTISKYQMSDYNHLWDLCRRDKVILKPDEENIEFDDVFKAFTNEQLKILFESQNLRKVVQYFKWYKQTHTQSNRVLPKNDPIEDTKNGLYYNERLSISLRNKTYQMNLDDGKERESKEIEELKNAVEATTYIYFILNNPKEMPELTDLVVNHLQYMTPIDLKKLLKMIDKKFEINSVGKPQFNIPIYVFDKYGELIKKYANRQECMKTEGLGKQYLYQLLSGKKRRNKCSYCEMTEEEYNEIEARFKDM